MSGVASASMGLPRTPPAVSPGDPFNWLFYDTDLDLFGCRTCHLAFGSVDSVRTHIKSKNTPHGNEGVLGINYIRKIKKKPKAISSMDEENQGEVNPNWVEIYRKSPLESSSMHKRHLLGISWLALHDGYKCALCNFCHRTADSIYGHMQRAHPVEWQTRQAVLKMQVKRQLVQTIFLSKAAKYFPVILKPNKSYWFSGRGRQESGGDCASGSSSPATSASPLALKSFQEISALCGDTCLAGTQKSRPIFLELEKANASVPTAMTTSEPGAENHGYGSTHTYTVFLALCRFDIVLQKCGFASFTDVPLALSRIEGPLSTDCSYVSLKLDISGYLSFCGRLTLSCAPFIREMVQLTGIAGSNVRKFKTVESKTHEKYASYLAQLVLIVLRTFSKNSDINLKNAGLKLFPKNTLDTFQSLTDSYMATLSKPRKEGKERWKELSQLFAALLLVSIPPDHSVENISIRQILALLSVSEADSSPLADRTPAYFSDFDYDCGGGSKGGPEYEQRPSENPENANSRRFKRGSEMSHLLASVLYCASCTSIYVIRCGENESQSKVEFVQTALSLEGNTAVAFVRDIMDKTSADRNSDTSGIRFSLCLDNGHKNDACGVMDGRHLSFAKVRAGLLDIENDMERLLEYDLLLSLDVDLSIGNSVISELQDRHTDPKVGFSFLEMEENKDMTADTSMAVLEHIITGTATKDGWAINDQEVLAGAHIRKFFIQSPEIESTQGTVQISGQIFKERSIRNYLQICQKFLQLMLIYGHVSGGGPPRCTETPSLRHRNGSMDKRNLFIDQSLFCFFHRYNKTRNITEKQYCIARFVPRKVSNLILVYFLYIRPLENLFTYYLLKKENIGGPQQVMAARQRQNEFIYVHMGKVYPEYTIRDIVSREFGRLGFPYNASQWRQYQNGMEREYMQIMDERSEESDDSHNSDCPYIAIRRYSSNTAFHGDPTQSGHSRRRADLNYARVCKVPRGISYTAYMRHRTNSILWHNLLGICCEKRRSQRILAITGKKDSEKTRGHQDLDIEKLAKRVAEEIKTLLPSKRPHEEEVDEASEISELKKQKIRGFIDGHRECSTGNCQHRELALYHEYIPYLRCMTSNPLAEFRSRHQLCAVATALHRKRDILLILGTGSGKTLLYLLVSYIEGERAKKKRSVAPLTIVIVPTRSLVQDIMKRCQSMGVKAVCWAERESSTFEEATVILLAVEQVLVSEYAPFLEKMNAEGRLSRIVSEECHLMIQWKHFRPHMNQIRFRLHGNVESKIPVIMASATVAPQLEQSVIDAHGADATRLSIIREATYRSNISYSVVFTTPDAVERKNEVAKMSNCVIEAIMKYQNDEAADAEASKDFRVLVYCPTKDMCRKMGYTLGNYAALHGLNWVCAQYTADLATSDKDDVFKFWVREEESKERKENKESEAFFVPKVSGYRTRIVVATSAFGTGIDVCNVRLVFHIGFARGLYTYAQESGRVGRDGLPSKSIVVYSARYFDGYLYGLKDRVPENTNGSENAEIESMQQFSTWATDTRRCRRKSLFGYLDNSPPPTCLVSRYKDRNVSLCDCCYTALSMGDAELKEVPNSRGQNLEKNRRTSADTGERDETEDGLSIDIRNPGFFRNSTSGPKKTSTYKTDYERKMQCFMQMARALKGTCAECLVLRLERKNDREDCLAYDACFNCLATGRTHTLKTCPLDFANLLGLPEPSCKACGLNTCMGKRLHKSTEWNWRANCPYRSIIEMFFIAWRTATIRISLCEKLGQAGIYILPQDHGKLSNEQSEVEMRRFLRCVLQTVPGEVLPNIIRATELLFETISYVFTM